MHTDLQEYKYSVAGPGSEYRRKLAEVFVSLVENSQSIGSICDLGSGNGYLANQLAALGHRVTGIDSSKSGVEVASSNYVSDNLNFICSEIKPELMQSYFNNKRFDAVVSNDVIEHLYRPSDLLETASLLLKPGGFLIVGAPYHGYLKNLGLSLLNKWDSHHGVDWDGGHIKFFSVGTLKQMVTCNGFEDPKFHFFGRIPWLWKNMICVARNAR
jgi:SAM-dependent methyltransferase